MFYRLTNGEDGQTLSFTDYSGDLHTVSESHPSWLKIRDGVLNQTLDAKALTDLLNIGNAAAVRLRSLSDRVSYADRTIFFDGDPVREEISNHIIRLIEDDKASSWKALVNFLEKVQTNPNEHSRDSLYDWISNRPITLTPDGDLIAYKGVQVIDGNSFSVSHGTAYVDGEKVSGAIPNPPGSEITMPRSAVQHDPSLGCSTGLHAGTWEYASDFSRGRVLTVKINPRDVVSVPTDCDAQKVRVSRYVVLDETDVALSQTTLSDEEDDGDFEVQDDEWWAVNDPDDEDDEDDFRLDDDDDDEEVDASEEVEDGEQDPRFPIGSTVVVSTISPTFVNVFGSPVLLQGLAPGDAGTVYGVSYSGNLSVVFDGRIVPTSISPDCVVLESELDYGPADEYGTTPIPGL